jgi:drug/metabolite transporter (DMT)-like permease
MLRPRYAVLLTVLGIFFFSLKGIFVKLSYSAGAGPMSFLYLRMLFAGIIYFLIFLASGIPRGLARRDHATIASLGIAGYFLASALDFWGLSFISAGLERLIIYLYPTLILFLEWAFFRKSPSSDSLIAVILTYIGLAIVLVGGEGSAKVSNGTFWSGAGLVFLSGVCYALFLIGSQSYLGRFGTLPFTTLSMLWASGASIISFAATHGTFLVGPVHSKVYLYALFVAVFTTVLPSYLVSYGVSSLGAQKMSLLGSLGPVSTMFGSYLVLGERMTGIEWIGAFFVILGILWAQNAYPIGFLKKPAFSAGNPDGKGHSP